MPPGLCLLLSNNLYYKESLEEMSSATNKDDMSIFEENVNDPSPRVS
jgi:dTDP-glucose pyrophosphorylase